MASLGAGFLKKLLLGSTTERVIKEAACPVLVTMKGARDFVDFKADKIKIRSIVCPVDFSVCSIRAVEAASDFAERFGAEVILLHVIEAHSKILEFFIEHFEPEELLNDLEAYGKSI